MNLRSQNFRLRATLFAFLIGSPVLNLHAGSLDNTFTYQGRLNDANGPANGWYDVAFSLFTTATGVAPVGVVTNVAVGVTNGLFTTLVQFTNAFDGTAYWLGLGVRGNSLATDFTVLSPRQPMTAAPNASYALAAGRANTANQLLFPGNNGNTAVGIVALSSNTVGSCDTAFGYGALSANTTGIANTAVGTYTLEANTTAGGNTAVGYAAMIYNTTGGNNTAVGGWALYSNTNGWNNAAFGEAALYLNTSGMDNAGLGYDALTRNTTGSENVACGSSALAQNTTGIGNVACGYVALAANTTGFGNTAAGNEALAGLTNGYLNTALGNRAGYNLLAGSHNIYIGSAGQTNDQKIIRIGETGIQTATYLAGTVYADNLALTSDRNAKENFAPVDAGAVLDRVAELPITQWNYQGRNAAERHVGPMAQDFQAAFHLNGGDSRHIAMVDEAGIALTAIQGLHERLAAKEERIARLESELAELKALVHQLAHRTDESRH